MTDANENASPVHASEPEVREWIAAQQALFALLNAYIAVRNRVDPTLRCHSVEQGCAQASFDTDTIVITWVPFDSCDRDTEDLCIPLWHLWAADWEAAIHEHMQQQAVQQEEYRKREQERARAAAEAEERATLARLQEKYR